MLNYSDFLKALRLSTESYGFTEEQVGMQMDTVARKAEQLKQQFAQLATGTGNITTLTKGLLDTFRNLLKLVDSASSSGLLFMIGGGGLAYKSKRLAQSIKETGDVAGVVSDILNLIPNAATSVSKGIGKMATAAKNANGAFNGLKASAKVAKTGIVEFGAELVTTLPGWLKLVGVVVALVGAIQMYSQEKGNERKAREEEAETLSSEIQMEQELLNRKEQSLQSIKAYAEGYVAIQDQLQNTNLSEQERNKLLKDQESSQEALINILGEKDAKEAIAHANETGYLDDIIERHKEEIQVNRDGLAEKAKGLKELADKELEYTQAVAVNLTVQKVGIDGVCNELWRLGHYWDWIRVKVNQANAAINNSIAGFHARQAGLAERFRDAGFDTWFGKPIQQYIDAERWAEDEQKASAQVDLDDIDRIVKADRNDAIGEGLRDIQQYRSLIETLGSGITQGSLGGSEAPEPSGTSKSSKKSGSKGYTHQKVLDQDGNEIKAVDSDNFGYSSGLLPNIQALAPDLQAKLRVLDDLYYKHTAAVYGQGEHLMVTSAKRDGNGSSNHDIGHAFDVAGGMLENDESLRQWLHDEASWIGLFSMNEYPESPYYEYAGTDGNGNKTPNMHFSDVKGSALDQYGGAEGLYTNDDNQATPLAKILDSYGTKGYTYTDNSVERLVYDRLVKMGLNDKQAWAAMANIGYESAGFNPSAEEDPNSSETGIGLMQWSNTRRHEYENWVAERAQNGGNGDWRDITNQLDFMEYEFNNGGSEYWQDFLNSVTSSTTGLQDVESFMRKVERAGAPDSLNARYDQYYSDASSYYANGMSLRDSNPSKRTVKPITPEERAEKRAKALKAIYDSETKSVDTLAKILDTKYKNALESTTEDQGFFGNNIENTANKLDIYISKMGDSISVGKKYQELVARTAQNLRDDETQRYIGMSRNDFLGKSLEEQQRIMANVKETSALYKPVATALNQIIALKQKIQAIDEKYHKDKMTWVKEYQARRKMLYEDAIKSEKDVITEWETRHANEKYDDTYKHFYEQEHLEAIAKSYREMYEDAQEYVYDPITGERAKDSAGNFIKGVSNPEELQKLKVQWIEAQNAAEKYAATLKNDVLSQTREIVKSILFEHTSLSDKLKDIWKQLGEDALTLLLSGGKEGTNSLLGNLLRRFNKDSYRDTVKEMNKSGFAYSMPETKEWQQKYNIQRPYRWVDSLGQATRKEHETRSVNWNAVGLSQLGRQPGEVVPVEVVNGTEFGQAIGKATDGILNTPTNPAQFIPSHTLQQDYSSLGSWNGGIVGQSRHYNWQIPNYGNGTSWAGMGIGNQIGTIFNGFQFLRGLFGHHADGAQVDDEELAMIGEDKKREYIIPVEQHQARGRNLWYKAGKDLGLIKDGTAIEPAFKNKRIAQNGVMNVQVQQQAIYMNEMRQQNKTLLNILSVMANTQNGNNDDGQSLVAQPIVLKQDMDINAFSEMLQKGKRYGYVK